MKKFIKEFKAFISKGSVVDLAIGVIIGGAFQKIISSLVNDIFMPVISLISGKNLNDMVWILKAVQAPVQDGSVGTYNAATGLWYTTYITMNWGNFLQTVIDFLLIALVLFMVIKALAAASKAADDLKKKVEAAIPVKDEKEAPEKK